MLRDRDVLIFVALLLAVIIIRFLPLSSTGRVLALMPIIVAQGFFVYNGLRRGNHRRQD